MAKEILARDILTPHYAALCYRFLWKFNPSNALNFADVIRNHAKNTPDFPIKPLFDEASKKLGIELPIESPAKDPPPPKMIIPPQKTS